MSDFEYSENTKKLIDSNPFNWKEDLEATITGYQSPITMIAQEIETKVENDCVKAVQRYGFDVNAKELYKALKYDREQYQKGYEDAKKEFERPTGEWITRHKLNSFGQDVVCFECDKCGEYKVPLYHLLITEPLKVCPNCGADMRGGRE